MSRVQSVTKPEILMKSHKQMETDVTKYPNLNVKQGGESHSDFEVGVHAQILCYLLYPFVLNRSHRLSEVFLPQLGWVNQSVSRRMMLACIRPNTGGRSSTRVAIHFCVLLKNRCPNLWVVLKFQVWR